MLLSWLKNGLYPNMVNFITWVIAAAIVLLGVALWRKRKGIAFHREWLLGAVCLSSFLLFLLPLTVILIKSLL